MYNQYPYSNSKKYDIINHRNYDYVPGYKQAQAHSQYTNQIGGSSSSKKYGTSSNQYGYGSKLSHSDKEKNYNIRSINNNNPYSLEDNYKNNSKIQQQREELRKKSSTYNTANQYHQNARNHFEKEERKRQEDTSSYSQYSSQKYKKQYNNYEDGEEERNNGYSSKKTLSQGPQPKAKADRGLVGLQNIGNTCFMNSSLQCLFNCPGFNDHFLDNSYSSQVKSRHKGIATEYAGLLQKVRQKGSYGSSRGESTYSLKNNIARISCQFQGYAQQDAQELLRVVLEGLHEDINRIKSKPVYRELTADIKKNTLKEIADDWFSYYKERDNSIVYDYFCGQMINRVICSRCNNESLAFDNFLDLSLSFTKGLQRLEEFSLVRILENFFKKEPLDDDYPCSKCKKPQPSSQKFGLWKLPNILVIHFKRFKFGRSSYSSSKLNQAITFPTQGLDMAPFVRESEDNSTRDCIYDLCGVVNHSGSTYGGHYTADCMNPYDNRWYRFNDSYVSEIDIKSQRYDNYGSGSAYILFYCKRSLIKN